MGGNDYILRNCPNFLSPNVTLTAEEGAEKQNWIWKIISNEKYNPLSFFFFLVWTTALAIVKSSDLYLQGLFQKELLLKGKFIIGAFRNYCFVACLFVLFLFLDDQMQRIIHSYVNSRTCKSMNVLRNVYSSPAKNYPFTWMAVVRLIWVTASPNQTKLKPTDPFILLT